MSRIVEDADLWEIPEHRGRPPKYDWGKWFDGRRHVLIPGEDFDSSITLTGFRSTLYSAAKKHGVRVISRVIDGELNVQAVLEDGAENGHTRPEEGAPDGEEE